MKMRIRIELKSETIFNSGEAENNIVNMKALTDDDGFVYFHSKTLKGQLKDQAFWLYDKYCDVITSDSTGIALVKAKKYANMIVELFGIEQEELKNRYIGKNDSNNESVKELKNGEEKEEVKQFKGYLNLDKSDILYAEGNLKIGDLKIDEEIRNYFKKIMIDDAQKDSKYHRLSHADLIKAQTQIRTSIQIGNKNVVEKGALAQYHTIKKGLIFYSELEYLNNNSKLQNYIEELEEVLKTFRRIGASTHRGRGEIIAILELEENEKGGN